MNYDEAREVKGGGWHWTSMNDGVVRTAPPCVTIRKVPPNAELSDADIRRCEPHATKAEAERHFYDYCTASLAESEWETARKCETGCETWTNKSLGNRGMGGYFSAVFLCDFHRRPEVVVELHPFRAGIQVIHS